MSNYEFDFIEKNREMWKKVAVIDQAIEEADKRWTANKGSYEDIEVLNKLREKTIKEEGSQC